MSNWIKANLKESTPTLETYQTIFKRRLSVAKALKNIFHTDYFVEEGVIIWKSVNELGVC